MVLGIASKKISENFVKLFAREREKTMWVQYLFYFPVGGGSSPPPFSVCMARLSDKTSPERLSFRLSETTFKNCILLHVYISETSENKYSAKILACVYIYLLIIGSDINGIRAAEYFNPLSIHTKLYEHIASIYYKIYSCK